MSFLTGALRSLDRTAILTLHTTVQDLARDVRAGLTAKDKSLPCKYFYDAAGVALFEEICTLPEYYLTRVETAMLREHAAEITARCATPLDLVELGSGSSTKTRLLIEACLARQPALTYVPIDISAAALAEAAARLVESYPALSVRGLAGQFEDGLRCLAEQPGAPRLVAFLGSTIGNLAPPELAAFFGTLRHALRESDRFLLGFDLIKDPALLEAAYDDAQGVTARFNLNLLARINRELDADFDLSAFQHHARFNREQGRIEMHLVSTRAQTVRARAIDLDVPFRAGEAIHTENCYKHTASAMRAMLARHGLRTQAIFSDPEQRFCLVLT